MEAGVGTHGGDLSEQQKALVEEVMATCSRLARGERFEQTLQDLAALPSCIAASAALRTSRRKTLV